MLTRLQVSGFKNLLDVDIEFGAFTCIAGENGIGKSNIFDAIQFLSYLADDTFGESAQRVRGSVDSRGGDPRDLFFDGYRDNPAPMKFVAEMIVRREVEDDLGAPTEAATTFLRYELVLRYQQPESSTSVGNIRLVHESLTHITQGDAARRLHFPHKASFRRAVVLGQRRGGPFLSTEEREEGLVVNVHGDGGSHGRPQPRSANRAGRTILSTVTTNEYPTIMAARREMQGWRRLALEPAALRTPDSFSAPRSLGVDGSHLASTLYRIASDYGEAATVYAQVANRLSDLAGIRVAAVDVHPDPVREVFTLFLTEHGGLRLPARALSEGTLRFLALCVLLYDPSSSGLICMEEPENGIHPANIGAMLELVQDLAVDVDQTPDGDNPLRQVMINTHSPYLVQLCDPRDLILATTKKSMSEFGPARSLSLSSYRNSWRSDSSPSTREFAEGDIVTYLTAPIGAQLVLPEVR